MTNTDEVKVILKVYWTDRGWCAHKYDGVFVEDSFHNTENDAREALGLTPKKKRRKKNPD